MNIKKIGNVMLAVKDLDRSLQFYHDFVGLPIKNQGKAWADLGTSGPLLSLHLVSKTTQPANKSIEDGIAIGFLVGDVKSALDELKAKDVKVHRDIVGNSNQKNAIVVDPDGYLISLFEPTFEDEAQQTGGYHGFTPA